MAAKASAARRVKKKSPTAAGSKKVKRSTSATGAKGKTASKKSASKAKTASKATKAKKAPAAKSAKAKTTRRAEKKRPAAKPAAKSAKAPATTKSAKPAKSGKAVKKKPAATRRKAKRVKHLTPKMVRDLRERLLEKRRDLLGSVATSQDDSRRQQPDGTEDYIDYAVSSYDREFLLSLTELEQRELMLVEEALARIDRGEYGYCLASGEPIPLKRLQVQPWARYSVRYQEMVDQGMLSQDVLSRLREDAVSDPLEGDLDDDEDWEDDDDDDEDEEESESNEEGLIEDPDDEERAV